MEVVGQGSSAEEALRLAGELMPDLMLLDFNMRDGGVPLVSKLLEIKPEVKVVFPATLGSKSTVPKKDPVINKLVLSTTI